MKKSNPLHITTQPLAGVKLPDDWKNATADYGGNFDRRNLSEMWKQGSTNKQISIDSPTRNARLKTLTWDEIFGSK